MTDLGQLIAKLEAASEGSRELDAAMFRAIGAPLPDKFANLNLELTWGPDGSAYMPVGEMQVRYEPPAYTTSLDAIVALMERKLPGVAGWSVALDTYDNSAALTDMAGETRGAVAKTLPLAACLAFLRAIQAQQETSEDE